MRIRRGDYQHDMQDCGAACLATICRYHGMKIPIAKVRQLEKIDMNGSSIYGITMAAKELALEAEGLNGSFEDLYAGIMDGEITMPIIAHVLLDNKLMHYIVIWQINNQYIWSFDPAKGNVKLKIEDFKKIWTGYIVTVKKTEKFEEKNLKKGYYKRYIAVILNEKQTIIKILLYSFVISAITIAGAFAYKIVVDHFMVHTSKEVFSDLNELFIVLIGIYMFRMGIYVLRGFITAKLSRNIEMELVEKFIDRLLLLPLYFFRTRKSGELIERFNDIRNVTELLSVTPLSIMLDALMAVVGSAAICALNPTIFGIVAIIILIYFVIIMLFKNPLYNVSRLQAEKEAQTVSLLKEMVGGVTTVKAYHTEMFFSQNMLKKAKELVETNWKTNKIYTLNIASVLNIEAIGELVVFWIGSYLIVKGNVSLGTLVAIMTLLGYVLAPVRGLVEIQNKVQKSIVSVERMNDVLESNTEAYEDDRKYEEISLKGDIVFENVSFSYGYQNPILDAIYFKIERGKKIAFVGENGCGKTTLVSLLLRFYDVLEGRITINGRDIQKIPLHVIRNKIAYIEQATFLFADTLRNNITMGENGYSDEEIIEVIHKCNLDSVMEKMPLGLNSILNENASNLSMGERQGFGIARALLKKSEILILDEVTSNLDGGMQKHMLDMINMEYPQTTCLFISHDKEVIRECDGIFVMNNGKIVESGTYLELMDKSILFRKIFNE